MIKLVLSLLHRSYVESVQLCKDSVLDLVEPNQEAKILDCGCNDGSFTLEVAKKIGTDNTYGIEISDAASLARANGIKTQSADLNSSLPFEDNFFDVVVANQLMEHLSNTDGFAQEIKRVLKPGGYAIISTNNLSSWHNIFSLLIGRQPFPSDVSNYTHIGKLVKMWGDDDAGSWSHLRVFTMFALVKFFQHHGFIVESNTGVGYYPFSGALSKILSKVDKFHAAYTTIKIRVNEKASVN